MEKNRDPESQAAIEEAERVLSQRGILIEFPPVLKDYDSWVARQRWAFQRDPWEALRLLQSFGPYCDLVSLMGDGEERG